jgi:hypothetical protein
MLLTSLLIISRNLKLLSPKIGKNDIIKLMIKEKNLPIKGIKEIKKEIARII